MKINCSISILFAVVFLSIPFHTFAEDKGVVRGHILDSKSGAAIAGANVLIQGTLKGAVSNEKGNFTIADVQRQTEIVLVVRHIGYAEAIRAVKITDESAEVEIALTQKVLHLADEIVVIAERANDAYLQNALRSNPDGGGRILRDIPGLQAVSRAFVAYDPVIHGMKEERINVTIDGIKIEPACNGRMDPATAYADLAELEAITVTKGPFAVSGLGTALGGSLNFDKLQPVYRQEHGGLKITGTAGGTYNSVTTGDKEHLRLGLSSAVLGVQLQISRQAGGNFSSARQEILHSMYNDRHLDAVVGLRLANNQEIRFAHYRTDGNDTGYPALPMDTRDHAARLSGVDYTLHQGPFAISQLHVKLYRSDIDHLMDNLERPAAAATEMSVLGETATTGGNLLAEWQISRLEVKIGLDMWHLFATARQEMLSKMTGMRTSTLMWPDVTLRSDAAFAEISRNLGHAWQITAGTRLEYVTSRAGKLSQNFLDFYQITDSKASNTIASGYLRLNFAHGPHWTFQLAVGKGGRAAGHKERYSWYAINRFDGYDYLGDPRLRAEQSFSTSLSLRYRSNNLQLRLEPYDNRVQDYIAGELLAGVMPKTMGANGVKIYTNIGKARLYGLDFGLSWQILPGVSLFSNVTGTVGRDLEHDEPLPEIPPLSTLSGIRYVYPSSLFWLQLETRAASRQDQISDLAREDATAAFAIYNMRGGLRIGSRIDIQTGIENLTNVFYHEHLDRNNIPQPGRNFYVKVAKYF